MSNTYEVCNVDSGHSFGFYPGATGADAIAACCTEAGYTSAEDAAATVGGRLGLKAYRVAVIPSAPYADSDDCLQAAADDYAQRNGLQGWDLSPRWEHGARDSMRDTIILTIPDR